MPVASIEAQPPPTNTTELTETEKWVTRHVSEGTIADLESAEFKKQFPNDNEPQLSSRFLEDLLTGALPNTRVHRNGVRIFGARILDPLSLKNAQVNYEVWLHRSRNHQRLQAARLQFAASRMI